MSSSMPNEGFDVFFISLIVIILISIIETASGTDLSTFPLKIPSKSVILRATLTDSDGGNKYITQEYISASDLSAKGKIEISGEKASYTVYYNTDETVDNERLVIQGTNCLSFTFNNQYDKTLPEISKQLTKMVLLMGPSILYRLDHSSLVWQKVPDKNIRGTMMKGATTEINNKRLKITYYYKKHFDDDVGIKNPSRIELSGYDLYSTSYISKENLILDIYLQNENDYDELINQVQPLPGIGCPNYLTPNKKRFPQLEAKYLHYTMYEHIQGSTNSRTFSEIHASEEHKILKLKATLLGTTTEIIYDYHLGISYLFQEEGSCSMVPADLNAPGINGYGFFYLNSLLDVDSVKVDFTYLGRLNLEHLSGFPVDAWEKVKFNVNINGKIVDKAVITQYFAQSQKSEIFSGYTLVSTTIVTYKLHSSTYTLVDRITRDYMNFEIDGSEDALEDIFTLKDCKYLTSNKQLTLGFKFECKGDPSSCSEILRKDAHSIKKDFMHYVLKSKAISPLRIDTVENNFNDNQYEIEVTFLDKPNLQSIFSSKDASVSSSTFRRAKTVVASNEYECLDNCAKVFDNIVVVIYRPSDSFCGYLSDYDDLKEDTKVGQPCSVYHFPLINLRAIDLEMSLDKIHDEYLESVGWGIEYRQAKISISDIVDKTAKDNSIHALTQRFRVDSKLKSNDQVTKVIPDVKTVADCYRACRDSEQLACNIFSSCENGDSIDCRVSSLFTDDAQSDENVEKDTKCTIYSLNVLNDYLAVHERKFKTPISAAVQKSLDSCAEACHASSDCISFQFCRGSCNFDGLYTDSATEYDEGCSIYFPKVSQKYKKTGNKIVSEVIITEMNVNLEQCASLCHRWSDGQTGCKSFNYCPKSKTESSCSLTKFSVKNADAKTIDGGECSNYEMKEESKDKKNEESNSSKVIKGTSGSGAFGIIMLFLFVGALLGFASPFAYNKVKHMRVNSEANENFTWSKQVDESAGNIK